MLFHPSFNAIDRGAREIRSLGSERGYRFRFDGPRIKANHCPEKRNIPKSVEKVTGLTCQPQATSAVLTFLCARDVLFQ